jgi:glycosyltransferase involved in cell wall biosynthesis
MRIALLMDLAPRKLGSSEAWLAALAAEAQRRGHALDVFGRSPVHPDVARDLARAGATWGILADLVATPFAAARHLARYDVVRLDFLQPRSRAALVAYGAWPARVLYMARSDAQPWVASRVRRAASRAADRVTFARVDSFAAVSDHVRAITAARFRMPAERGRVLYNGIDTARFRPPDRPRPARPPLLVAVAHLVRHKGVDVLLRAFAAADAPAARLRIVGDGPALPSLRSLAAELGIESRVEFLGLRDDVPELLREADAFVHPTLTEGFGNAVAEAMASGLAVVVTRVGGLPEIVEDGVSGLLVPPGDAAALAAGIEAVARDAALRARLGGRARQRIVERFGLAASVAAHLDWCEERAAAPAATGGQGAPPRIAAAVVRR